MSLAAVTAGWIVGWAIGLAVVVLVVVLLLLLRRGAFRAANKAESIVDAFNESRDNTEGLWNVDTTNRTIVDITSSARAAREYLESAGGQP
jgi:hypothetical protein